MTPARMVFLELNFNGNHPQLQADLTRMLLQEQVPLHLIILLDLLHQILISGVWLPVRGADFLQTQMKF